MSDEKKSLADQLRGQKAEAETKGTSLADKMRAQKAEKDDDDKPQSLADKMRQQKEEADKPEAQSLADKINAAKQEALEQAKEADKPQTLAEKMKQQQATEAKPVQNVAQKAGSLAQAVAGTAKVQKPQTLAEKLKSGGDSSPLPEAEVLELNTLTSELSTRYRSILGRVGLSSATSTLATLGQQISSLPADIENVRKQGYVFRSYLESKVDVLQQQWNNSQDNLNRWLQQESQALKQDIEDVEDHVNQLNAQGNATRAKQANANEVKALLDTLEAKVDVAEEQIQAQYQPIQQEMNRTRQQLQEIAWFLEQRDQATFEFYPEEKVYLVAKAEWDDGDDKPDGMLFMTDQRLVFEQKEKTGKKFGLFGGKDTQGVLWEAPMTSVENVESENKGFMGGKDMIHLTLGSGASYPKITVEIKGGVQAKYWAGQLNQVRTGNANQDRAVQQDPELIERLRNAPTECPTCGGTLPQIMAGQNQVDCTYCGTVIRI